MMVLVRVPAPRIVTSTRPERLKPPSGAYQSDRDLSTRSDLIERVRALGQESPEVQQYADETVKCLEYGCYS